MNRRGPHASTSWLLSLSALLIAVLAASLALVPGRGAAANEGAPSVTGVEVTYDAGNDNTYFLGETITITVTFSEVVNVTGTPRLCIDMDPAHLGHQAHQLRQRQRHREPHLHSQGSRTQLLDAGHRGPGQLPRA